MPSSDVGIFAINVLLTCLGVPRIGPSEKKKKKKTRFIPTEYLTVTEIFEGSWLFGTHFRLPRPPQGLN